MKKYTRLSLLVVSLLLAACAENPASPIFVAPKIDEIVQMSADKVSPQEIIAVIRESHAVYSLTGSQLVRLHDQGVSDAVIDELLRLQIEAARDEEWKRATARPVTWLNPSPTGPWTQQSGSFPYAVDPGWWHH